MVYVHDKGSPFPLGSSKTETGVNFALFSKHATSIKLVLIDQGQEIALDPIENRTGFIWHLEVKGLPLGSLYGYRVEGPSTPGLSFSPSKVLIDPYARELERGFGRAAPKLDYAWEKDRPPLIPMEEMIIYEMHVRGFTQHPSSHVKYPGTFRGIIEKIPHLKALGINAVELMPIHFFDEKDYRVPGRKNYWGYMPINYFSPMSHYGTPEEFKQMVKELHHHQIEVILDVVFNHTAEGADRDLYFSFKGIDNQVYYLLDEEGKYRDYTGCGNTLNCNNSIVTDLIMDSLHYWVSDMHVDGFRFDLASVFSRDEKGIPIANAPLIQAISEDPLLANVKLIAEAWDAAGLYQVGSFAPNDRWAEWNGKYRDMVRRFIKGTSGITGAFATAICGSEDLYWKERQPYHSINFVTAHDGFTLHDLVSYNRKHNLQNSDENRDGMDDNESWNGGVEGETDNHDVLTLRLKQKKNFHLALMLSLGTPMLLMGDEYGHTRKGNNNAWCQDNELNWFLWNQLDKESSFFRFYTSLIRFRKTHRILKRSSFLTTDDVDWHGTEPFKPDWGPSSRFLAYTLKDKATQNHLYIAFNPNPESKHLSLPPPPEHKHWYRIVDTSLPSPDDFIEDPTTLSPLKFTYDLPSYSALLAKAF